MQQCLSCRRFSSRGRDGCPHCRHPETMELLNLNIDNPAYAGYQVFIQTVTIADRPYRLIELLNRGGYGIVFKVSDEAGNLHALKVPLVFEQLFTNHQANSQEDVLDSQKYLDSEIRILNQLQPETALTVLFAGIATAYFQDRTVRFPAILMELAVTTLANLIQNEARGDLIIPAAEKYQMIRDILASLDRLHRHHTIHRDLSPDNVFVVRRGDELHYLLADFGASKYFPPDQSHSHSLQIVAKDFYVDPERLTNPGFRYDERSDIWSAGVVITELLAGNFWSGLLPAENLAKPYQIDFEKEILGRKLRHQIPAGLVPILQRATRRTPRRRFPTVAAFAAAFEASVRREVRTGNHFPIASRLDLTIDLTLNLPLQPDSQPLPTVLRYTGNSRLEFSRLGDHSIRFPHSRIKQARVRGTRLFTPSWKDDTLTLALQLHHFSRHYHDLPPGLYGVATLKFSIAVTWSRPS
jgi:serine/threonine protein kinase